MLNHTSFVKYFGSYLCFSQNHSQSQFLLPWLSSSVKNSSFLWVGLFCPCLQNGCYFIYSEQFFLQISIKLTASLKAMRNSIFFSENSDDVHVILAMDGAAISTHAYFSPTAVFPPPLLFSASLCTCRQRLIWLQRCVPTFSVLIRHGFVHNLPLWCSCSLMEPA